MRPHRPFSNAALKAEFVRLRWSGRAEEAIEHAPTRLALIAAVKARLQAERAAKRRSGAPAVDHKRRQANDID